MTSFVNSRVRKIGVSEIRKSAGHFVASFTQRNNAAYFSGVKSALNFSRSSECIPTMRIAQRFSAGNHRQRKKQAPQGRQNRFLSSLMGLVVIGAFLPSVETLGYSHEDRASIGPPYIKNIPARMTGSPSNQMSKSRPTQSMCVFDFQSAPVCSEYGWPKAMWIPGFFSSCKMFPITWVQAVLVPMANSPTRLLF